VGYIAENSTCLADPLVSYHNPSISQAREARDPGTGSLASSSLADSSAEADGAPDGLAHEPRRHGVQPVCRVPWTLRRAWRLQSSASPWQSGRL
jgi:hypothetical protein